MAEDWEKLAGESGEKVTSNRFKRMFKLGSMGARVGASTLAAKVGGLFSSDTDKREEALQKSYEKNAQRVVQVLGQLKGASMKIGQMLSADPEGLPDGFSDALKSLQHQAPPMTYETVRAQIEAALDRPIEAVFSYFDPEPLGSASIGQVHRGRLQSGEDVAIKVQYPGVVDSLESDLKSLSRMLIYARVVATKERLDSLFTEIHRLIMQEADYRAEGENLARFYTILSERDGLRCPRPYMEWTRETVLVMEYIEGQKFDEALDEMGPGTRRDELLLRWVATFSWMFHELLELHADPHPGNFLLDADNNLVLLDFGCVKAFEPAFTNGLLDVLDACWQDDDARAVAVYRALEFGTDALEIDPTLLREYHKIVLAPFLANEAFDFGGWTPALDSKKFMLDHPAFMKLTPPPDALAYFRVLSGIKGLLHKMDAHLNICTMAIETARRRDRLTAEPLL